MAVCNVFIYIYICVFRAFFQSSCSQGEFRTIYVFYYYYYFLFTYISVSAKGENFGGFDLDSTSCFLTVTVYGFLKSISRLIPKKKKSLLEKKEKTK